MMLYFIVGWGALTFAGIVCIFICKAMEDRNRTEALIKFFSDDSHSDIKVNTAKWWLDK